MKLGTHNSLSYAKPTKWWMKLINFTSKCQDMTIEQQWEYGVRYFDIRVSYKDFPLAAHGLITYNCNIQSILKYLNEQAEKSGDMCYISLNLEDSVKTNKDEKIKFVKDFFNNYKILYKNLTFCGGYCKSPWRKILENIEEPYILHMYWEYMNWDRSQYTKWEKFKKLIINTIHFSPKYWAKKNNREYKTYLEDRSSDILLLDFVQYE